MTEAVNCLSYDEALKRAQAAFDERHPRASLPDWFDDLVGRHDRLSCDEQVVLRYFVQPELPPGENQVWAVTKWGPCVMFLLACKTGDDGSTEIVENPDESTPRYLVHPVGRQPPPPRTIFCASVDPLTGQVEITLDSDLDSLDLNDLERPALFDWMERGGELIGHWTAKPTPHQAEQIRCLLPAFHHTMPSRIIRAAVLKEPLHLGRFGQDKINRLVLELKPLGLAVEVRDYSAALSS